MDSWMDIKDYEGYYKVNKNGIVKSLDRKVPDKRLGVRNIKGITLIRHTTKFGYVFVQLWKDKKQKNIFVHRILAETYIDNPFNKSDVNHKNGVRNDNRICNLEWMTRSENAKHGYQSNGRKSSVSRQVYCVSNNENYKSITNASLLLNISISNIAAVCKGRRTKAGGMVFKYIT